MSEYIFYTNEGFAQAPDGNAIDNCQLLGCAYGDNKQEALDSLLNENPWIVEREYNPSDIICKELSPVKNSDRALAFLTDLLDKRQLEEYSNWLNSL